MISLVTKALLDEIVAVSLQAGKIILDIYNSSFSIDHKDDQSPVTTADIAAHEFIIAKLSHLTPHIPIISEEGKESVAVSSVFWLVDPLDGTKEFINRNDEFTVNIALIENNLPKLGVVYAPALNVLYAGIVGGGAFSVNSCGVYAPMHVQPQVIDEVIVVGSRRHGKGVEMEQFLARLGKVKLLEVGSSLKFCKVAVGDAHIYPRFGRTMEWDTAAGQAIVMAAGGHVEALDGSILTYGKEGLDNPHFMVLPAEDFLEKHFDD